MSWRDVLYEYVRNANARETDCALSESFLPSAAHHRHSLADRARLKRLKGWYEERGAHPLGCDTHLSFRAAKEEEWGAVVDINLRRTVYVRTKGTEHSEERVDRERLTFQRTAGGEWIMVRTEPIVQERYGGAGPALAVGSEERPPIRIPGTPFLNELVLSRAAQERPSRIYDREAARDYAERHWNDPNPQFIHFDVDCTNYVSQCLYAGGAPMNYTDERASGWWYKGRVAGRELWSYSWSVAHAFHWYLMAGRSEGLRAAAVGSPRELTIGDVICYDFDGDGRFEHSTIVTGADGAGMPLVNTHTANARNRYWDYRDSYAWTERTMYRFFRIHDIF